MIKKYAKEDVIVVWNPSLCQHSTKCFHGLPEVFNPSIRPWINVEGADKEMILEQVKKCPSGAISIENFSTALGKE